MTGLREQVVTALRRVGRRVRGTRPGRERGPVTVVTALSDELPVRARGAVGTGPETWDDVRTWATDLVGRAEPAELAAVPVASRVVAGATVDLGRLDDVALVLDLLADNPHGLPHDGTVVEVDGVPASWRRIEDVDRPLRMRLTDPVVTEDTVVVDGAAFREYTVDGALPEVTLDGVAAHVEARPDPLVDAWAERAWEDHADAGFRATWSRRDLLVDGAGELVLRHPSGLEVSARVDLAADPGEVVVDRLAVHGQGLQVEGRYVGTPPAADPTASLRGPRGATERVPVTTSGDRFGVVVPLTTVSSSATGAGEPVTLPHDHYDLVLHTAGRDLRSTWSPELAGHPPELIDPRIGLLPLAGDGTTLAVTPPWRHDERGARGQHRMRTAAPGPILADTVLLETFRGASTGDNPGAIARELASRDLGLDLAWVVDDPRVTVPPGTRAVARRTREWFELMARARLHVTNAGAPYWWSKQPGQVHLQTWHGTPLKRIGEDRGPGDFATWRHRRRIAAQAANWDVLLSPSPYCTPIFRSAFRFDGEVLETGYPRNDVLVSARAEEVRTATRQRLGLGPDRRVVLYAPTWRTYAGIRDAKPLYLDAERLTGAMPDATVLVRGHYNATGEADVFAGHDRILDVTRYPDIADLYLAADVLVTDYSSVMFDFALTDKPIVLLTPDLEQYRDAERGFYFDLEARAPGPLVATTDEVVDALGSPDAHAAARAAFREEFCPYDDGSASARVVDHVLTQLDGLDGG